MRPLRRIITVSAIASLLFLGLVILSGWGLSGSYVPSLTDAFPATLYLEKYSSGGHLLRSIHYYSSSGLVFSGFVFLCFFYISGFAAKYRKTWILGVVLYLLIIGSAFTGYVLPLDQNAYWGTKVRLGIVETVPLMGTAIADFLRGGATFNSATLPRFFTLHGSVLAAAIFLCLFLLIHSWKSVFIQYLSDQRFNVTLLVSIILFFILIIRFSAPLELPADPADVEYNPRPEWYFLWLFQFGKYVEWAPWIQSGVLPLLGVGFLFAVPWLRNHGQKRRSAIAVSWCLGWLVLTGLTIIDDKDLPDNPNYSEGMAIGAEKNFNRLCVDCHGPGGLGDGPEAKVFDLPTPDFTAREFWNNIDEQQMIITIRDGKGNDMPDFGGSLTYEQILALIHHIEKSFKPNYQE
jgi:ubiquinol-cytochrome c reductase cytochrome b subunit